MTRAQLMTARVIWGAIVMSQILFAAVAVAVKGNMKPVMAADQVMMLHVLDAVLLAAQAGVGFIVWRAMARPGEDGSVDGRKYLNGLVIFLAGCEAASLFGIVLVMLSGKLHPGMVVPAVAVVVQLFAFPRGRNVSQE
jgi:hypothetical protein